MSSALDSRQAHTVGRPGSLTWALDVGGDSVDTSSIVRGKAWGRLDALERHTRAGDRQATLGGFGGDSTDETEPTTVPVTADD